MDVDIGKWPAIEIPALNGDLAREIRALGGPIAKRRAEAVGGEIIAFHSAQQNAMLLSG
jgi:hypothetical protein